jgi:hypothetical protein
MSWSSWFSLRQVRSGRMDCSDVEYTNSNFQLYVIKAKYVIEQPDIDIINPCFIVLCSLLYM